MQDSNLGRTALFPHSVPVMCVCVRVCVLVCVCMCVCVCVCACVCDSANGEVKPNRKHINTMHTEQERLRKMLTL